MNQMTQQNAALVEEAAEAAENLQAQAARLSEQVSRYKVKNSHGNASVQLKPQIVRAKRAPDLTNKAKPKLLLA